MAFDPTELSANNTHGAILIGLVASIIFFGILLVQVYYYFEHYYEDPLQLKALVVVLAVTEVVNTSLAFHGVYKNNISGFFSPLSDTDIPWTLKASFLPTGITYCIVQSFLAFRIKVISRQLFLTYFLWGLAFCRFVADVLLATFALQTPISVFVFRYKQTLYVALILGLVVDSLVASTLSYWLVRRSQNEMRHTNKLIKYLLTFSIESGLVMMFFGIAILTCIASMPNNYVWIAVIIVHSKAHSNSLLVSLNKRRILAMDWNNETGKSGISGIAGIPLRSLRFSHHPKKGSQSTSTAGQFDKLPRPSAIGIVGVFPGNSSLRGGSPAASVSENSKEYDESAQAKSHAISFP